jgi:osmotically-inducible protein OsmY
VPERNTARGPDDNKITRDIRARLKAEPTYKFNSVNVSSSGGVVRLSGLVDDPGQRKRAEEIARSTGGVSEVLNGLVFRPAGTLVPAEYTTGTVFSEPPNNQNTGQRNY